jgi:YidC/Oxa1 family membrane protein insertase
MFDAIATVLAWFYELWPSYGMAIVFLTLSVMIILTPLTLKGTRSMMVMQRLQPEMKKIQARYKDDRQKLNEELLAFYKENKINPVGGCLPLLIQMPVFLVLFRVLRGLTDQPGIGSQVGKVMGEVASGKPPTPGGFFEPDYISHDTALYAALHSSREMVSWGIDLAESASKAMSSGFGHAFPYLVLILGVAATSYIQQRQVAGRNPNAPVNPQQQMLLRFMPVFFAFISLGLPAALVVYFLVSNVYRIGQQAFISKTIYNQPHGPAGGAIEATAREPKDDGDAGAVATKSRSAEPAARGSFLSRLLASDAAPKLGGTQSQQAGKNGKGTGTSGTTRPKEPSRTPDRNKGGGRVTPPASKSSAPQPRARKKKKRK